MEDAAAARDQYAELLPVRERVSGPEHPATLATQHNLAYWTGMAGDAAAGRDQYAALLPVFERVFGPEHPETLSTRADLAYWIQQAEHGHGSARTSFPLFTEPGDCDPVADLCIVSGIGCPVRRACSCIAVRHSWIVASMVKRQRTFSQLAYGTGVHRV